MVLKKKMLRNRKFLRKITSKIKLKNRILLRNLVIASANALAYFNMSILNLITVLCQILRKDKLKSYIEKKLEYFIIKLNRLKMMDIKNIKRIISAKMVISIHLLV